MVTTEQKSSVNSQEIKRRELKHITKDNHHFIKTAKKGRKEQGNYKEQEIKY